MPHSGYEVIFAGRNLLRLLEGLWVSAQIALIAMLISVVAGTLLGLTMVSRSRWPRLLAGTYLAFIRIMPQLVLLFLVFFELTRRFGVNLDGASAAIVVFSLWGTAELGDLVRAAVTSIPAHQYRSAQALGLSQGQLYRAVILPQALRRLVPPTINLTNRMIMTTSLVALIGVVEVLKVAQQIIDANRFTHPDAALWVYGFVLVLYFAVCFPIAWLCRKLERKWQVT